MSIPNTYSAKEAGINPQGISPNALRVVEGLQQAGYQAYLVGGCVRDLLLDKKPKDFDVTTDATPEQIKATFRNGRIIGRRFKIVHVRFGYEVIEVATFRANASDRDKVGSHEMTEGDQGQLLRDNVYGSIDEDVVRRDFTVNALYYDPVGDEILDFVDGITDLRNRKLISIGEPKQRFREDPVRMLRVIRFASKLDFEMESEAQEMIEEEGKLLSHVSSARLFEEVLKLFHGGAAFDTYMMLRKYGLFKYLFPFTDQGVSDDVIGMPERALQNTDKRIKASKPVIPAFLFACMMWDPVQADARILMTDGTPEAQAWRIAMNDCLRDQNQYVAVPRRLAEIVLDIWNIQFRLVKRNPRMVKTILNNRRFRAAYDFLLLRSALHEVDEEIGEWWTLIQEVDDVERDEMIVELGHGYKGDRSDQHQSGEKNGNSVDYNEQQPTHNRSDQPKAGRAKQGQGRGRAGQKKPGAGGRSRNPSGRNASNRGSGGRRGKSASTSAGENSAPNGNSNGNSNGNGGHVSSPSGRGRTGPKGRRNPARGASTRSDGGYVNARPKDEYGNHTPTSTVTGEDNTKKVKVRHKRRVPGPDSETDNNPHF
ncbi:MAG: poly(A) polymerase [Dinoroseobacter sp.]